MSNLATTDKPGELAPVQDYGGGILAVIERAARDPSVDVDKMERLFAMQERVLAQQAKVAFTEAKIAMRPELPEVTMKGMIRIPGKDNKPAQETPFARFEDIHDAVMPIITAYGFDLKYKNGLAPDGKVRVTTILSHIGGHEETTEFDLPHDSSGSKNSVQAVGSSTSYGKRYGTIAILNIKVAGEDDDGQAASYKDSSGEPMARAKLDGPHSSKTALKAEIQKIRNEVRACTDVKVLNALLKAANPTIEQAQRDWTVLLTGFPDIPEDVGLKGDVAVKRAELAAAAERESVVDTIIASMKECGTPSGLKAWVGRNGDAVDNLSDTERRQFERAYEEFEAGLQMAATVHN
jgi:hypothetical protein